MSTRLALMERWRALAVFAKDCGAGSCQGEGKAWWIAEWGKHGMQANIEVERLV